MHRVKINVQGGERKFDNYNACVLGKANVFYDTLKIKLMKNLF